MGFGISRMNTDSQWKVFHQIVIVETKLFVSSNANMILTRQTCGQRSSRAAGGKRQALAFYFLRANVPYVPDIKCKLIDVAFNSS